ncbi:MAG: SDR family oxidoreductase [Pseudomonadota bacterium]
MRLGILGAGFSGKAIGALAAKNGADVWGTTRSQDKFDALRAQEISPVAFDGETVGKDLREALADTTHLVVSIAPSRKEDTTRPDAFVDPTLKALGEETLDKIAPKLEGIDYLSTVGVYGNHDGAWVDEETPVAPASERSRQRVRAEAEWLALGEATGIPVAIMRLSGIYGPGRNGLVSAHEGRSRRLVKPGQVFNRIHVDDIAQATWLAASAKAGGIFNITDHEPAPPQEVVAFAHSLLGTEPPPEIDFATADLTPMARSFYGENKRVSNACSRTELGLVYANPDYRTALSRMVEDGTWRGRQGE